MARGTAAFHFDLPNAAPVRLRIYDAAGRFVRELVDEGREAGRYVTTWDGRSTTPRETAPLACAWAAP